MTEECEAVEDVCAYQQDTWDLVCVGACAAAEGDILGVGEYDVDFLFKGCDELGGGEDFTCNQ